MTDNELKTKKQAEVTGRNGYLYPAEHLSGNLWIVGKFVVVVLDGVVQETVCPATSANLTMIKRRAEIVG